jgi:hypothetical protein
MKKLRKIINLTIILLYSCSTSGQIDILSQNDNTQLLILKSIKALEKEHVIEIEHKDSLLIRTSYTDDSVFKNYLFIQENLLQLDNINPNKNYQTLHLRFSRNNPNIIGFTIKRNAKYYGTIEFILYENNYIVAGVSVVKAIE